ncbi:MAG: acyl-CoA thioesterase [Desulfobacter sp.]|nr:acyl-CoA thioesterase [Desulfobacter sp.]WDP86132.1 MAG: acyl-CoA thioesterase [Desulfobacter sp.]
MKQRIQAFGDRSGTLTIDRIKWHKTRVIVQVSDTDYGGGVYHGKYFALYNQARDQFMADLGFPYLSLMTQDMNLSVAELHTRFLKPLMYGETPVIHTRVSWLRTKSLGIVQQMFTMESCAPLLKNQVEMNLVCTNARSEPVALPNKLKSIFMNYYGR